MSSSTSKSKSSKTYTQLANLTDNGKYANDFMFDLTFPPHRPTMKMLDIPMNLDDALKPLSSLDVGDVAGGVVTDNDGPLIDLINPFAFSSKPGFEFQTNDELLEDFDPTIKKKSSKEILGLRAPTYLAVEFTADELNEAGRGIASIPQRAVTVVQTEKQYTLDECFSRAANTYKHPLKPGIEAEEAFHLLPDPELFSTSLFPFIFEADPINEDVDLTDKLKNSSNGDNHQIYTNGITKVDGSIYPNLILCPLGIQAPGQHITCQLFAEIDTLIPTKTKTDISPEAASFISSRGSTEDDVRFLGKLRCYQGVGDAPSAPIFSSVNQTMNANTATASILVSLPKKKNSNHRAAYITKVKPRVQLTKALKSIQLAVKPSEAVMMVVTAKD